MEKNKFHEKKRESLKFYSGFFDLFFRDKYLDCCVVYLSYFDARKNRNTNYWKSIWKTISKSMNGKYPSNNVFFFFLWIGIIG
jgi:hypothetical protein